MQTSRGYGMPMFGYLGERVAIKNWHENKGTDGIREYWDENNLESMGGLKTGVLGK